MALDCYRGICFCSRNNVVFLKGDMMKWERKHTVITVLIVVLLIVSMTLFN